MEDPDDGPWNVVTRFTMNPDTLMLDFDEGTVIWRGACVFVRVDVLLDFERVAITPSS